MKKKKSEVPEYKEIVLYTSEEGLKQLKLSIVEIVKHDNTKKLKDGNGITK